MKTARLVPSEYSLWGFPFSSAAARLAAGLVKQFVCGSDCVRAPLLMHKNS